MSRIETIAVDAAIVGHRYRDNSSRHLLGVTHYLQTSMMRTLQTQCGHPQLRLGFAPYISLIGERACRLTELARLLGISRQACNKAIKTIEDAGYIAREAEQDDARAKTVFLTPAGSKLRRDGMRIAARLDQEFAAIVGDAAIGDASKSLRKIHHQLGITPQPPRSSGPAQIGMSALLPSVAEYVLQRLMELTRAKGHSGLQLRFGQVLTMIGSSGGRIQHIASFHDVSKQAISVIATELVELGYLRRDADPADARQIVLNFTARGQQLIADSVRSVDELEAEFAALIGAAALKRLNATLQQLYHGLHLDRDDFDQHKPADIDHLALQLQQQLGPRGSQALAKLLLGPPVNSR